MNDFKCRIKCAFLRFDVATIRIAICFSVANARAGIPRGDPKVDRKANLIDICENKLKLK